ncbi:MAG: hypothetical protein KGK14_09625 [Bacteroidota bacterium]|nr:hypothetical protein [Bacteroidota bacterium]
MHNKNNAYTIALIVCLLMAGVWIYWLGRPDATVYEHWLSITKSGKQLALANWVPDFCWCYALLASFGVIWHGWINVPFVWKMFCWVLPIGSEYLQWLHIIPGTADVWDVFRYIIVYVLIAVKPIQLCMHILKHKRLFFHDFLGHPIQ